MASLRSRRRGVKKVFFSGNEPHKSVIVPPFCASTAIKLPSHVQGAGLCGTAEIRLRDLLGTQIPFDGPSSALLSYPLARASSRGETTQD